MLAADPALRARDPMEAFTDPAVRAAISSIGGEDSMRLLPHLDAAALRSNPKVLMGDSDTTTCSSGAHCRGSSPFTSPR